MRLRDLNGARFLGNRAHGLNLGTFENAPHWGGLDGLNGLGSFSSFLRVSRTTMGDRRAAEADPYHVKFSEIGVAEVGITLSEVFHRFIHPVLLIFFGSMDDATAVDVAKKLVPSTILELGSIGHEVSFRCFQDGGA